MWKAERTPDAAGRLDNLKELVRSMGEFPDLARLPRACVAGDGRREAVGGRARLDHDAARGEGPRIRDRLPAGLGGGPLSAPAIARRQRPRRARGGTAPRLCRPHPRPKRGEDLSRRQPAGAGHVADVAAVPVHRRTARRSRRVCRDRRRRGLRRLRRSPLRRVAGRVCLPLRHAGLAPGRGNGRGARATQERQVRRGLGAHLEGQSQRRASRGGRVSRPARGSSTSSSDRAASSPSTARN